MFLVLLCSSHTNIMDSIIKNSFNYLALTSFIFFNWLYKPNSFLSCPIFQRFKNSTETLFAFSMLLNTIRALCIWFIIELRNVWLSNLIRNHNLV